MRLKIKKLSSTAQLPVRAYRSDAGLDLYADEDGTILGRSSKLFKTGLQMAIPNGYYGDVRPRSSWFKDNYDASGVIDSGYRGEVMVMLHNHNINERFVRRGERIAQLIIQQIPDVWIEEVDELPLSDRGEGGFGSTGR